MLVSFKVDNYKSFGTPNTLMMTKGTTSKMKSHFTTCRNVSLLKGTVIYGSNAGGKTSFLNAINAARGLIRRGFNNRNTPENSYCRTNEENRTRPTEFEFLFETKEKFYDYDIKVILSERRIVFEQLSEYIPESNENKKIFTRNNASSDVDFETDYFNSDDMNILKPLITYMSDAESKLVLSELGPKKFDENSNLHIFNNAFDWLTKKLHIGEFAIKTKQEYLNDAKMMNHFFDDFKGVEFVVDKNIPSEVCDFASVNLDNESHKDIAFEYYCFEKDDEGNIVPYSLKSMHQSSGSSFVITEESTGLRQTLRYLDILSEKCNDDTFIFDEFGNKMHPLLVKSFIEMFYSMHRGDKTQLIMATHHTTVMSLDVFRRDEVWLVNKEDGESNLYSLEECKIRDDAVLERQYFAGRFGALPLLDDL